MKAQAPNREGAYAQQNSRKFSSGNSLRAINSLQPASNPQKSNTND